MFKPLNYLKKSPEIFNDHFTEWFDEESSMHEQSDPSEEAMIRFAKAHAITPPQKIKESILQKIIELQIAENNRQSLHIDNLPLLDATSNWLNWQACVQHISPPDEYEGVYLHTLENSPQRDLFIAWVKNNVEEEVHLDLVESFIMLEGSCECSIRDTSGKTRSIRLSAGDYLEIPVGEPHDMILTSLQPVKAILQWHKIRA